MSEKAMQHSDEHLRQMQIEAHAFRLRQAFNMSVPESIQCAEQDVDNQRGPRK